MFRASSTCTSTGVTVEQVTPDRTIHLLVSGILVCVLWTSRGPPVARSVRISRCIGLSGRLHKILTVITSFYDAL